MIAVMVVIFIFSNQGGEKSGKFSDAVAEAVKIEPTQEWIPPSVSPSLFGFALQTWAYFILFACLGFAAMGWIRNCWKAICICYGYAVIDEIYQLFIQGREAKVTDTFTDVIGFVSIIVGWYFIGWMLIRIKEKRK